MRTVIALPLLSSFHSTGQNSSEACLEPTWSMYETLKRCMCKHIQLFHSHVDTIDSVIPASLPIYSLSRHIHSMCDCGLVSETASTVWLYVKSEKSDAQLKMNAIISLYVFWLAVWQFPQILCELREFPSSEILLWNGVIIRLKQFIRFPFRFGNCENWEFSSENPYKKLYG